MPRENKNITTKVTTDSVSVLRVAICDDEREHVYSLREMLLRIKGDKEIKIEPFFSSENLLQALEKRDRAFLPDIIFLDIEMPEIDGILVGKRMRKLYADIYLVFITAYSEYAVRGYEARAFRYILKPFSEVTIADILFEIGRERSKRKKLIIQENGEENIIPLDEIIYICAEDKYTVLYTKSRHHIERLSLNHYEKLLLPYGFYRVHRKYIVNLIHHKGMTKGNIYLTGDICIPVSRRRENAYHEELLRNLERDLI